MANALADLDILTVRLVAAAGNQVSYNILTYEVNSSSLGGIEDTDVGPALDLVLSAPMVNVLCDQATYRGLDIRRRLPTQTAPLATTTSQGPGGIVGSLMPRQTCGVIGKGTGLGGRRFRGRSYIPFPAEESGDVDGTPEAAYVTLLQTLADAIAQAVNVTGAVTGGSAVLVPVLFHDALGTNTPITNCVARPKWGTQRRRGSYGQAEGPPF